MTSPIKVSIIIPVLNEEQNLAKVLDSCHEQATEIIVVDGGSTDRSLNIAKDYNAKIIKTMAGRGHQLNQGANIAQGGILLFLHGDTILPSNYQQSIYACLASKAIAVGAFRLKLSAENWKLRLITWGANLRSRIFGLPYGDQGFFMTAQKFKETGGFPATQLMEDFIFIKKAKKIGKISIINAEVISSSRRWQEKGLVKTTALNQLIVLCFFLGFSTKFLAKLYGVRNNI